MINHTQQYLNSYNTGPGTISVEESPVHSIQRPEVENE